MSKARFVLAMFFFWLSWEMSSGLEHFLQMGLLVIMIYAVWYLRKDKGANDWPIPEID